jgi:hypothetical protein
LAEGKLNAKGEREVFFELNGQMRSIFIQDEEASKDIVVRPKAQPGVKGSIGAPMPGDVNSGITCWHPIFWHLDIGTESEGGRQSAAEADSVCAVSDENGLN